MVYRSLPPFRDLLEPPTREQTPPQGAMTTVGGGVPNIVNMGSNGMPSVGPMLGPNLDPSMGTHMGSTPPIGPIGTLGHMAQISSMGNMGPTGNLPQPITNTPLASYYHNIPPGSHIGPNPSQGQTGMVSPLVFEASQKVPIPPYATLKPSKESLRIQRPKRSKRRSKFTQEQDDTITSLKRQGKSWLEIAQAAGVESYLAARNRYQVLIGQQGGGTSECGPEEVTELQSILDEAELEKLRFIAKEFKKSTGRAVDAKDIRELLRSLFWRNPSEFDFDEGYLAQLEPLQRARAAEFGENDRESDCSDIDASKIDESLPSESLDDVL